MTKVVINADRRRSTELAHFRRAFRCSASGEYTIEEVYG